MPEDNAALKLICKDCGQPMLPPSVVKVPNEYDHAQGCPNEPAAPKPKPPSNEQRYFDALKRIARAYDSASIVIRNAEKRYGLQGAEALEMAYDNLQAEAASAIHGKRRPKS